MTVPERFEALFAAEWERLGPAIPEGIRVVTAQELVSGAVGSITKPSRIRKTPDGLEMRAPQRTVQPMESSGVWDIEVPEGVAQGKLVEHAQNQALYHHRRLQEFAKGKEVLAFLGGRLKPTLLVHDQPKPGMVMMRLRFEYGGY